MLLATLKQVVFDVEAADRAIGVRPETAVRLMQLAKDETSSAAQVEKIIDADPSMTMRTLKLANSALYGMRNRIARIDRAVAMLGVGTVAKLAASCSLEAAFHGIKINAPGVTADTPWRYSLSVALATEMVVREFPSSASVAARRLGAEAFVAGLIHDVGILVQAKLAPEALGAAINASLSNGMPLVMMERRHSGIDHAEIGRRLAVHWSLPPELVNGIGWHHEPFKAEADYRMLACVIHVAGHLVRRAGVPCYDGDTDAASFDKALEHLRIDPRRADKLTAATVERLKTVEC